jgi:hypothetical protein
MDRLEQVRGYIVYKRRAEEEAADGQTGTGH